MNDRSENKKKKEQKKNSRRKKGAGLDLCACGGGHQLKCEGICREKHTNSKTGCVECGELYQIENFIVKDDGLSQSKRNWKFGRQKDGGGDKPNKQQRRDKMDRDRS